METNLKISLYQQNWLEAPVKMVWKIQTPKQMDNMGYNRWTINNQHKSYLN